MLDFSKAFDKISHQRHTLKLQYYGIRGSTLDWIFHSYLIVHNKWYVEMIFLTLLIYLVEFSKDLC